MGCSQPSVVGTWALCNVLLCAGLLFAEDVVVVKADSDRASRQVTGMVMDYTGEQLTLRHASGREERIPAASVVEIQGAWSASHREANELFAAGDYEPAAEKYRLALREEERRWAQRRVLAQLTWCYRNLGRIENAVKAFVPLYRDDSQTPYLAAIPLTWNTSQSPLEVERQAGAWLQDTSSPVARLVGASWLLSSARRTESLQVLRGFVQDPDPRLVFLAEAQLWRTQIATSTEKDVKRWQQRVAQMPTLIRGGPYFMLGLGQSRHQQHESAALSFLRTTILYPDQRDLLPHALLAAARELETIQQSQEATSLYREILTNHPTSQVVDDAESRLRELVGATSR